MHKKELVIAAYDKPLEWLAHVPQDVKISVYRKGIKSNIESEIFLEKNIGRCVHTFFNHIANNYDNLSEWTYFAQDFPFDHWSNLIDTLINDQDLLEKTCSIYYKEHFCFDTLHNLSTRPANEVGLGKVLFCDLEGNPNHGGLPLVEVWGLLFDQPNPGYFEFNPGGHFCVSKTHLHRRTNDFYKKIVHLLENGINPDGSDIELMPYCIERLENYIFNDKYNTFL